MTTEEIKGLLRNVCSKKSRLKALQSYIDEQRALIEGVGAVKYDSVRVKSSPGNGTEERYTKYMDKLRQLQDRFDKLFDSMCEEEDRLNKLMEKLSPTEYEVILNRYLRGFSRYETAKLMGYSDDGIKSAQKRALKKMSRI